MDWVGSTRGVESHLDAIVRAGALRVGRTEDYRPLPARSRGVDVDMATSLAHLLGVMLEIVKTSWPALKSDLGANSFDIAMAGSPSP